MRNFQMYYIDEEKERKKEIINKTNQERISSIEMKNFFFDLKNDDLKAIIPYNLERSLESIENLTEEEARDSLNHFQKKNNPFKNKEDNIFISLDEILFATSSKNDYGEQDYYLLNNLNEYLLPDDICKKKEIKKITIELKKQQNRKTNIFLRCFVQKDKFSENIIENFLQKSTFSKANELYEAYKKNLEIIKESNFRLTIKIQMNSLKKIYYNSDEGEFYFELQTPPIFSTNFLISGVEEMENNICLFPFRNFEDEFSNLKYRNFVVIIKKKNYVIDLDDSEDTLDTLYKSFKNLFSNARSEEKLFKKKITLIEDDKMMGNLSDFFNYENNEDIKTKLEKFLFLNFLKKKKIQK